MRERPKILCNKIKCNTCGDIIESTYRHDFKHCKCEAVFVDGGLAYLRRGWETDSKGYTELSEHEVIPWWRRLLRRWA